MKRRFFAFSFFLVSFSLGVSLVYLFAGKSPQSHLAGAQAPQQISASGGAYRIYRSEIDWIYTSETPEMYVRHGWTNIAVFYENHGFVTGRCDVSYYKTREASRLYLGDCELYQGKWAKNSGGGIETTARHSVELSSNTGGGMYVLPFEEIPPAHTVWEASDNSNRKPSKQDEFNSLPNLLKAGKTPFSETPQKYVRVVDEFDETLATSLLRKL